MRTQTLQNSQGAITSNPVITIMFQELIIIGTGVLAFISSQIFHELGHFAGYKIFGYKPAFGFNNFKIPDRVTAYSSVTNPFTVLKLNIALLAGIIAGLIPILVYFTFSKTTILSIWFLVVYFYSCKSDFKSFVNKEVV